MKKLSIILSLLICSSGLYAQLSFNTGDTELDLELSRMNNDAKGDFTSFKADLSLSYNVSEKEIDRLHLSVKMEPAEIFLALELAKISKRPIQEVVEVYTTHKDKGWGFIAKQIGIKPGSPEFHTLKGTTKSKGKDKGAKKGKKG